MIDVQLENQLARWLAEGPVAAPRHLANTAASYALAHPRSPRLDGWRSIIAGAGALTRPMPLALRPVVLLVLLALTFALGAFFYAAWHNNVVVPQPTQTVQASPSPAAYVCPPGSSPDQPGPADQQQPWTGTSPDIGWGPLAFDAASGELLAIDRVPMSIWAFDVCHNTWAPTGIMLGNIEPPQIMFLAEGGAKLVVDEIPAGSKQPGLEHSLVVYDRATGQVVGRVAVRFAWADVTYRTAPGRASGTAQVIAHVASQLWAYDYGATAWRQLEQGGDLPMGRAFSEMAYDAATDRLVLYTRYDYGHAPGEAEWGPRVYEYDFASSTWTREPDPAIDITVLVDPHHFAFDEANQQLDVYFGDASAYRYDSTSHVFVDLDAPAPPSPELARFQPAVAYDSVNHRLVIISAYVDVSDIVAFDPGRRQWFQLLGPVVAPTPKPSALAAPSPLACTQPADC